MNEYSLPKGALQLTLDLDQPRVAQIFMANQVIPGLTDGYERTIEIYTFNKSSQIVAHSREVVIYDTEMVSQISPQLKATRSNSHLVIPLIRNHYYSHPQYHTIDFCFLDLTRLQFESFKLKVNT